MLILKWLTATVMLAKWSQATKALPERNKEREKANKTKRKEETNKQSCTFGPSCRKHCVAGGGVALWEWIWPTNGATLLPEYAGTDGGQREDSCSVCCPADCCWLLQHPAPLHWEDLWCCAGTQRSIRQIRVLIYQYWKLKSTWKKSLLLCIDFFSPFSLKLNDSWNIQTEVHFYGCQILHMYYSAL